VLSFGPNIFVLVGKIYVQRNDWSVADGKVAVHFGLGQHAAIAVRDGVGGKGVSHVLQVRAGALSREMALC